jgi:hypothetical protein
MEKQLTFESVTMIPFVWTIKTSKYYIQTQQLKEYMFLRTEEFVKEPIRIKNRKSQEVTSNTIPDVKALKYYMSM